MDYTVEESGVTTRVILAGDLTITHARNLKGVLEGLLKDKGRIVVILEKVTDIDISALQILCAAHKSSMRLNKEIVREGLLCETVNHAVLIAGFQREKPCAQAESGACLWAIREDL